MGVVTIVEHGLFHQSRGGELSRERMKGVVWMLSFLSELGCVEFEVVVNWQDLGFLMEVNGVGVPGAAGDSSQRIVLDGLEVLDVCC